jgi:hypothetical protein
MEKMNKFDKYADVSVWINKTTTDVLLMEASPCVENGIYLGNTSWGKLKRFTWNEFSKNCFKIITESLQGFASRDLTIKSEFAEMKGDALKKFMLNHYLIGVSPMDNGEIWLDPTRQTGTWNSCKADPDERCVVMSNATNSEFMAALRKCVETLGK